MTWLKKAIYTTIFKAIKVAWQDPTTIYQSRDFPWVFLGSAEPDDLREVSVKTGVPPEKIRHIDVTSEVVVDLPPADLKVPLPDAPKWRNHEEQNMWKSVFWNLADDVANIIRQAGRSGEIVYIHCSAGKNRSVATLAAALSQLYAEDMNMPRSPDQIISEIREQRTLADPVPEWRAFANEYGEQQMSDISQKIPYRPIPAMEY